MLDVSVFEELTDDLGKQKKILEETLSKVRSNLDKNKTLIGKLNSFEDTALLVPAMSQSYERLVGSRLEYSVLTPLAQSIYDVVGGKKYLDDNDIRVSQEFKNIMDYLGRPLEAKYIMAPITELVKLKFSGPDTFDILVNQDIDTGHYGKSYLEVEINKDTAAKIDLVLTGKKTAGVVVEHKMTIPKGTPEGTTIPIGDHENKEHMYIGVQHIQATGGEKDDNITIKSVKERN